MLYTKEEGTEMLFSYMEIRKYPIFILMVVISAGMEEIEITV